MLSKLLLVTLLGVLLGKLGLRQWLKRLMPRVDRAVNATIVMLTVLYVGQLVWWFFWRPAP